MNEEGDKGISDDLKARLQSWSPVLQEDPDLAHRIRAQVQREQGSVSRPLLLLPRQWMPLAACFAILFALLGVVVWQQYGAQRLAREQMAYRLFVNPLARVAADSSGSTPADIPSIVDQLDWMRSRFQLSKGQFLELVELHQSYRDRFETLYLRLAEYDQRYQGYEHRRESGQMIDFLALYDLLQDRDAVRADAQTASEEFVRRVLAVLTPVQQQEYLALLQWPAPDAGALDTPLDGSI